MTHYSDILMRRLRPTRFRVQGSTLHADFFFSYHGLSNRMPAYRRGDAQRTTIDTSPFNRGPASDGGPTYTGMFSHNQPSTPFASHEASFPDVSRSAHNIWSYIPVTCPDTQPSCACRTAAS